MSTSTNIVCSNVDVPLFAVVAKKGLYRCYPSCQRNFIWKTGDKQALIDTILRGIPISPITVIQESDEYGTESQAVVDGQQRLETIIRFTEGEFKTARKIHREPNLRPVEPNKYYQELSQTQRARFDNYPLPMRRFLNIDSDIISMIFTRYQYGKPLNFAERMFAHEGVTKRMAAMIQEHSFWKTTYSGNAIRRQPYLAIVQLIMMEQFDVFVNMTTPRIIDQVAKDHAWRFDERTIPEKLAIAERLFHGADVSAVYQTIPIYQCIQLLQQDGYRTADAPDGCLTVWWMGIREKMNGNERRDKFSALTKVTDQRTFWAREYDEVTRIMAPYKTDQRREFSAHDKIVAWNRQNGICPMCNRQLAFRDAIAHHRTAYIVGGTTSGDNCIVLHQDCHKKYHATGNGQPALMLQAA